MFGTVVGPPKQFGLFLGYLPGAPYLKYNSGLYLRNSCAQPRSLARGATGDWPFRKASAPYLTGNHVECPARRPCTHGSGLQCHYCLGVLPQSLLRRIPFFYDANKTCIALLAFHRGVTTPGLHVGELPAASTPPFICGGLRARLSSTSAACCHRRNFSLFKIEEQFFPGHSFTINTVGRLTLVALCSVMQRLHGSALARFSVLRCIGRLACCLIRSTHICNLASIHLFYHLRASVCLRLFDWQQTMRHLFALVG